MGIIKNLWRGFRGGPDFSEVNHLNASFENIQYSVELPYSNIETVEPPRPIHFPFLQEGWFEEHSRKLRHDQHVNVDTQLWYYVPAPVYLPNGELGVLSFRTRIKRIPEEQNISAFDLDELGKHLIREYEGHYNSPIIGWDDDESDPSLGYNTKIWRDVRKQSENRIDPWPEEEIEKQVSYIMNSQGYAPLEPHEIKTIKGRPWVFYTEQQSPHHPTKDRIYCMPLSDKYYLCLSFGYRVDRFDKFKLWKDHAEAAEKRIMESVKLTIPNDERALTHQA